MHTETITDKDYPPVTADKRVEYVCSNCRSPHAGVDALACWNPDTQDWELSTTYEAAYCPDCACDQVELVEIELN